MRALIGRSGRSRDGDALAYSVAPEPDLQPWFAWFAGTHADKLTDGVLDGGILSDHACVRVLHGGTWTAHTADGPMVFEPGEAGLSLYFGPQRQLMPISVNGTFKVVSIYLGVGGATALRGPAQADMIDRIVDYDEMVGRGQFASLFDFAASPKAWYACFAREFRRYLREYEPAPPDPIAAAFDARALADPAFALQEFADEEGISIRTLERVVARHYGITPKQVLRRARALDLAAALLGVAMDEDEAAMRLRYFDQSHQIREIRKFFDCTPGQLRGDRNPLLRLNLEIRQSRRVEALARLAPDAIAPWRDPDCEL